MLHTKYWTVVVTALFFTNVLSAQNTAQNKKDTIVLSVYNTNQRFMLYPAPFGGAIGKTKLLTDLVAAYDTVMVRKEDTRKDTSRISSTQKRWLISTERGCNKIEGDVKGKVAIINYNPSCDISKQMFLAQSKGAKAVIIVHTTNSKDTVWLDYKLNYAYAKQITIPCYTVRQEMGVKISQMLPSLVGIARKDTSSIPIQTLQTNIDSIVKAASAPYLQQNIDSVLASQHGWVLSPNPADDEVTVLFSFASPQNAVMQISNNTGAVVQIQKRDNVQSGTFTIDVSAFPTGVYNVSLQHSNLNISKQVWNETKRLLVTH